MGLFDFFKHKEPVQQDVEVQNFNEINEKGDRPAYGATQAFSGNGYQADQTLSGFSLPIDMVYTFLKQDFEQRGYQDALTNPDKSYKDTNVAIIRSKLEVLFRQTVLRYSDMLREIDFHIHSREQAGLTDIVELLKARKISYTRHIDELNKMKADLESGELYMTGIFKSYEVGFTRGLASISLQNFKMDQAL